LLLAVLAALLLAGAARVLVDWDAPLWLDETYTAAIAIQPTLRGLVEDCLRELGGPVYYSIAWAWEKLAGPSDTALRLPSLVFALAAPIFIFFYGHSDRQVRLIWAALAALWLPGLSFASEARSYSLLFLLATAQTVVFYLLLRSNSLRHAAGWCAISALLILTHYHALVIAGLQGLGYLALHRRNALRNWPATLVFIPVVAWMSIHLPLHFRFAAPDVAWQQVLAPSSVLGFPDLLFGGGRLAVIPLLVIAGTSAADMYFFFRKKTPLPYTLNDVLTVGASALAIGVVFGIGFLRPSFSSRYLIPYMPGLLFGIALWARHWGRRWPLLPPMLLIAFGFLCARDLAGRIVDPARDFKRHFSWQEASAYLASHGAERVLFLWDNPTAAIADPEQLSRVGGFFYERAGKPVKVDALVLAGQGDIDPNAVLATRIAQPGQAFIWISDVQVAGTLAIRNPPNIRLLEQGGRCRNFGRDYVTVLACVRVDARRE
jgi:hypothetical protein